MPSPRESAAAEDPVVLTPTLSLGDTSSSQQQSSISREWPQSWKTSQATSPLAEGAQSHSPEGPRRTHVLQAVDRARRHSILRLPSRTSPPFLGVVAHAPTLTALSAWVYGLLVPKSNTDSASSQRLRAERNDLANRIHALEQELTAERGANREFAQETQSLQAAIAEQCAQVQALEQDVLSLSQERDALHSDNHTLNKSLQKRAEELRAVKEQLMQYKKIITNSNRLDHHAADDTVQLQAGKVFFDLQSVIVRHFRGIEFGRITTCKKSWTATDSPV